MSHCNTNQNYSEVALHRLQMTRIYVDGCVWLWGSLSAAGGENGRPSKWEIVIIKPSNSTDSYITNKNENVCLHRNMYMAKHVVHIPVLER